jgi:outer membrane protein assembly factor BamB
LSAPVPDRSARVTRRQFLGGAAAVGSLGAVGAGAKLIGASRGSLARTTAINEFGSVPAASTPMFRSRPDLRIPTFAVDVDKPGTAPGLIFVGPYGAPKGQAGAIIADGSGQAVWEYPSDLEIDNFGVQTYQGRPALAWWQGKIAYSHGVGSYVIANDSYEQIAHVQAGNGLRGDLHEFLLTSRGTALLTCYRITHADLRSVGGSRNGAVQDACFQEVDLASGRVLLEWHSLGHIALAESYWPVGELWDYVHLNSIDVDVDGNLLVSSRNTHTVYKVDRRSGEIIWRLGGKHSDFAMGAGATFAWQHDVRIHPGGTMTIFDNEGSPFVAGGQSRAIVLAVDQRRMTADLRHEYRHPSPLAASSKGSVQLLPNGNVFVGWGAEPFVSEFSPSGELLFDARLGDSYIFYRAFRMPWTGNAPGTPTVVTERSGANSNVYVSWNGDTRVTRWTALAGTSPTNLAPVETVPRTGFETIMRVPGKFTRLRVRGIDATGATVTTTALLTT